MARKVIVDDESPEITPEMFAKMRPMKEVAPDLIAAIKTLRGRPKLENPKQVVSHPHERLRREAVERDGQGGARKTHHRAGEEDREAGLGGGNGYSVASFLKD
jgi:hypothetical protein